MNQVQLKAKYTKMSSIALLKMFVNGNMKLPNAKIAADIFASRRSTPAKSAAILLTMKIVRGRMVA